MSLSKYLLPLLGLGAIAYAASRGGKGGKRSSAFDGPTGIAGEKPCFKGRLRAGEGSLIRAHVDRELGRVTGATPQQRATRAASEAMRTLCPQYPVPDELHQVANYRQSNGPDWTRAHTVALNHALFKSLPPSPT